MNNLSPQGKIAEILRTDKHYLSELEKRMTAVTGKTGVLEKIISENEELVRDRLLTLGVQKEASAKEVYDALISKIDADDHHLFEVLAKPVCRVQGDCQRIAETSRRLSGQPKGFFLKHDKAREFILKEPPEETMRFLGYDSAEKMLASENLLDVYSSLRFIEGSEWLNGKFFKQYETLTPDDFEEREIEVRALDAKWGKAAEQFVVKKKHNISHLKELGVVFVIPTMLGISGEILRMFALILHYLYEIPFYSGIVKDLAGNRQTFAVNFISLLRGDVLDRHFPDIEKSRWLVVQRYLAKDDENDWRLFVPHINPEALHWQKAEESIAKAGDVLNHFEKELNFWKGLDWVGDYFKDESGVDVLVSFNLVDTVMSLVKEKEMVKYLYHHQEALWNKIFSEYLGGDQLEKFSRDYLLQGYFEV